MDAGDILAAMFFEENSYAVYFLKSQGISRLDVLSYHFARDLQGSRPGGRGVPVAFPAPGAAKPQSRLLESFTVNLIEKAARGLIDPLIGRDEEILEDAPDTWQAQQE